VLHALRTAAELFEDTAVKVERQGAEQLAEDFRRRARGMLALADRIEQANEVDC
jgi:hypothetical protein